MCGFVGFVSAPGASFANTDELVRAGNAIRHRGPDDSGEWLAENARAGLGFRRLSIIDLSSHGHQPMASDCGRYTMVFNGEIYNYRELRAELEAGQKHPWRGHSDTEVLLELIRRSGLQVALSKVDGMFAMALWDNRENTLNLARDRFGEKPLYYGWSESGFVFGSELKALKALPGFRNALDRTALSQFFRLTYVPDPRSIYESYKKLPPGTFLELPSGATDGSWPEAEPYWSAPSAFTEAAATPFQGSYEDLLDAVEARFEQSIAGRLQTDVPIGAFLSGGVDSSLTSAFANRASASVLKTFTIGFDEEKYNEAPYAEAVASHLGTEHTTITVREADVLTLLDSLPAMYDEPFADASQLPTALLCQMVREHVTVALSGDGGDELFCGYDRYVSRPARWPALARQSARARNSLEQLGKCLPVDALDALHALRGKPGRLGKKWLARLLENTSDSAEEFMLLGSSYWRHGVPVKGIDRLDRGNLREAIHPMTDHSPLRRAMFMDATLYLPGDLMVKVDRASMANSLEVRTPFLNAELASLAWSIPKNFYDPQAYGLKRVLRDLMRRYVPDDLVDRPKMGFEVPLRTWLRQDLRAWGDGLVNEPGRTACDALDMDKIATRWRDHQRGANAEGDMWPALIALQWMRETCV